MLFIFHVSLYQEKDARYEYLVNIANKNEEKVKVIAFLTYVSDEYRVSNIILNTNSKKCY